MSDTTTSTSTSTSTSKSTFRQRFTFEHRYNESARVLNQHPDRVPIICEKSRFSNKGLPDIDKVKYLVPRDLTIGQFIFVIRRRMSIRPEEAIFLFIANVVPPSGNTVGELYERYKDADGFLYTQYSKENVFG